MENDETMIPDKDVSVFKTPKGINEDIVREISAIKGEPEWMLEYRLKALDCFLKKPMPTWGVDLSRVDFDEYTYYIRPSDKQTNKWEEVPETIKDTFDKLGIPEAEQKYLSGVTTQYESEVVYHNMLKEVQEKGVIFLDIDSGLREYPELFKKYNPEWVSSLRRSASRTGIDSPVHCGCYAARLHGTRLYRCRAAARQRWTAG